MRADELTRKQDEKFGHFAAGQLQRIEAPGTPGGTDFYRGSGLKDSQTRGRSDVLGDVVRQGEGLGNFVKRIEPQQRARKVAQKSVSRPRFTDKLRNIKNIRRKSAAATLVVGLLFGGGFLVTETVPAVAPIQLKEVFSSFTNYQQKALDSSSASVMRAKFKSSGEEACESKACKQFSEMTEDEAKNLESRNKDLKINLTDVADGSGKIASITYTQDSKTTITADSADKFTSLVNDNQAFRTAWSSVYNVNYESVSDPKARETFVKDKASKNMNIDGQNDEERQKKLNQVVEAGDDSSAKTLKKTTDKDGKTVYTDESGKTYSQVEYDALSKQASDIENIGKAGGLNAVLDNSISRALTADQAGELVCSTWNTTQRVSMLAKTVKKLQAIRYALALSLTLADKIKAGDASEEEVNFAGNTIMTTQPDKKVVDDSKLKDASNGTIPLTQDPEAGGTGLDAPSYKMAAYGDVEPLSSRASKFILTAGSVGVLDAISSAVAKVVSGGNPDPKVISQKCGYLQSNAVRIGALGLGLVLGVATFGTWQIAGTVASVAWSIAQPSVEAAAADMLTGNLFKDISGMDSVDATYIGTASLMGDIAQSRGMVPVTNQEGEDYINGNAQSMAAYKQDQQYLARATPFDVTNRYSFMGSILFALTPTILQSRTNISVAMMSMASMIPTTFGTVTQTAKADAGLPSAFFNSCPDQYYDKVYGIKAGPYCEMLYTMPQDSMELSATETFNYMTKSGNIDPNTKEVKDNGQEWNYAKYLEQCPNRKIWGDTGTPEDGDGTNCLVNSKYEQYNKYFRAYLINDTVNTGMGSTTS